MRRVPDGVRKLLAPGFLDGEKLTSDLMCAGRKRQALDDSLVLREVCLAVRTAKEPNEQRDRDGPAKKENDHRQHFPAEVPPGHLRKIGVSYLRVEPRARKAGFVVQSARKVRVSRSD